MLITASCLLAIVAMSLACCCKDSLLAPRARRLPLLIALSASHLALTWGPSPQLLLSYFLPLFSSRMVIQPTIHHAKPIVVHT